MSLNSTTPCACGCGLPLTPASRRRYLKRYLLGHTGQRVARTWDHSKLILCACGCGQQRLAYDKRGDRRYFIVGHTLKGKHLPLKTRRLIAQKATGRKLPLHVKELVGARYRGKKLSPEHRAKISAGLRRSNHPRFNGGRTVQLGYLLIRAEGHPAADKHGYIRAHRLVVEEALGRYLLPDERVHHIDGDTSNNALENLMLFQSERDHQLFHNGKQVDGINFNSHPNLDGAEGSPSTRS